MTGVRPAVAGSGRTSWKAGLLAAIAAVASFGVLLAIAWMYCLWSDADCNTAAFLVLPLAAVAFGIPVLLLLCFAVLLPVSRRLARHGRSTVAPITALGAVPGLVIAGAALVWERPTGLVQGLEIIAYLGIGLGLPGAIGAFIFQRLLKAAASP
jgi:hypothetical protein